MPPRPLRPKDDPAPPEAESSGDIKTNKRRAVSSACIPCRRRKSKCDGNVPSCATCTAVYRTECHYDADSDHRRKGALKRDIHNLQQRNDALDVIVASLRSLPESEAISLFYNLRGDSHADELANALRTNVSLPDSYAPQSLEADFAQQLSQSPSKINATDEKTSGSNFSRHQSIDSMCVSSADSPKTSGSPVGWFRRPQDAEFVDHLLSLYFAWVHPFYHIFSRDHFLFDMGRGKTEFCSAMLVNAVLAFACHYSDRPSARVDPGNPNTAGDEFFAEAKLLLDGNEKACLTTVQALGIMSVRECSHGRESNGYQLAGRCVRMALELGLHLSVSGSELRSTDVEVRKITFWGVFNLETICSVEFGRLSQLPRAAADIQKPSVNDRSEAFTWRAYEDTNLVLSPSSEQPGRPMLFVNHQSRLAEIACDMVNTFYAPQERFTSRRLAATYAQYQGWYNSIPDVFRLENTSLPQVLVLHMYYHACVLHLFRPYIKLDLSGAGLFPRDTCTYCANEISSLMNALRAMYGLRRVCLAVPALLLSASTIHLLNLPSESATAHLAQALYDLQAISVNHQFGARCVEIIRSLAAKWNISLPENPGDSRAPGAFRTWPSPRYSTFFAASIPRQSPSEGGSRSGESNASRQDGPFQPPRHPLQTHQFSSYYGDQARDTLWTPFPLQGAPMTLDLSTQTTLDFSMVDSTTPGAHHTQQWSMFSGSMGSIGSAPTSGIQSQRPSCMGDVDGSMSGMDSWNWQ